MSLKPYYHEQPIKRVSGYANSPGGRISENHRGITVFADYEHNAHRPSSVTITWATIKAALRRKQRHEVRP